MLDKAYALHSFLEQAGEPMQSAGRLLLGLGWLQVSADGVELFIKRNIGGAGRERQGWAAMHCDRLLKWNSRGNFRSPLQSRSDVCSWHGGVQAQSKAHADGNPE
jgi:hypothetical protein